MSYDNVEVKITVKVDGQRVGRRKVTAERIASLQGARELLSQAEVAMADLADELRGEVGV